MKRHLTILLLCMLGTQLSHAVLKEKNLTRTLGVLKLELERNYKEQKMFMARYEVMSTEQHDQLVDYMLKSEQIGLMLYSQKTDFTFDVAYACQQATDLYRTLHKTNMPYHQIRQRILTEVARYDSLIVSLRSLPPAIGHTEADSTQTELAEQIIEDSLAVVKDKVDDPFLLSDQEQRDRMTCLFYAVRLRNNLVHFLNTLTRDNRYYNHVSDQVERLNNYAQQRYVDLQRSIFKNGGRNYFLVLNRLPQYVGMMQRDVSEKYFPIGKTRNYSEWRGPIVLGVSIFMLFYIFLATLLSNLIVRGTPWLLKRLFPRHAQTLGGKINELLIEADEYKQKRTLITLALGIFLFAIAITVIKQFMNRNLFIMSADLMINLAWLMEAILISLLIRLNASQLRYGLHLYMPFIFMAFIVIIFRILLVPNSLVNIVYPPLLLVFVFWQWSRYRKYHDKLPLSDSLYSSISLVAMVVGCVCSWLGYSLLAVQIMIWWTFQLAAIQTITCLYDLTKMYEERVLINKIQGKNNRSANADAALIKRMRKGDLFVRTWLFDFVQLTAIPVLAVLSVLMSIYWAADIFAMTSVVRDLFFYNFIDRADVLQISLFKLCLVVALFFLFRYVNYAIRSYYHYWYRKAKKGDGNFNETLARNVIAILAWGTYFWISLIILQVPKSGISIVTAGLATGLGFAMKDLLENFFYGISLMTGRVRVGDYIECDGIQGKVESITYQSTQITTLDGSVIAFLNSSLFSKNFKNLTRNHGYVLTKVPIGVAYGTDVEKVRSLLVPAMEKLRTQLPDGRHIVNPKQPISVTFADFGDSSVDLVVVAWVLVDQCRLFMAQMREVIYNVLNENNIEIPFPQRDVHMRQ